MTQNNKHYKMDKKVNFLPLIDRFVGVKGETSFTKTTNNNKEQVYILQQ